MTDIAHGRVQRKVDIFQAYEHRFGGGQVATTTIGTIPEQYSALATVGLTEVAVLNELIDPGVGFALKTIQVELTCKTTYLGSAAGSMMAVWDARSEWNDPVGTTRTTSYVGLMGTFAAPVGSAATNTYEHIFGGYLSVASLPNAPLRLRLYMKGGATGSFTGKVRNTSFVKLVGIVVPGA